jgi:hypothetical protein
MSSCQHPTIKKNNLGTFACLLPDLLDYNGAKVCKKHFNRLVIKGSRPDLIVQENYTPQQNIEFEELNGATPIPPPQTSAPLPSNSLLVKLPYEQDSLLKKIATEETPPSPKKPAKKSAKKSKDDLDSPSSLSPLDEEIEEKAAPQKTVRSVICNNELMWLGIINGLQIAEATAVKAGYDITGATSDLLNVKDFRDMSYAVIDEWFPGAMNMDECSPSTKFALTLIMITSSRYLNNRNPPKPEHKPEFGD